MMEEISEQIKNEIFKLISTPGVEIEEISENINSKYNTNLDYNKVMTILSDEYLKYNLDYGRRICCRF